MSSSPPLPPVPPSPPDPPPPAPPPRSIDPKKAASICITCASVVASTVVTMVIPSVSPWIGVPVLVMCGIALVIAAAIWLWPSKTRLIISYAVAAAVLLILGALLLSYVRSSTFQDYLVERQFNAISSAETVPLGQLPSQVQFVTATRDASAVCFFALEPVLGFVQELTDARCAIRDGAGYRMAPIDYPHGNCQIRTKVLPAILLSSGDLVTACQNTGEIFALNVLNGSGWRKVAAGSSGDQFINIEGSNEVVRVSTRTSDILVRVGSGGIEVEYLCPPSIGPCGEQASALPNVWQESSGGNVYGIDYRDQPYYFEVNLATRQRREMVLAEPSLRFFDRDSGRPLYRRYGLSVWQGRSQGRDAIGLASGGRDFRLIPLDLPADVRIVDHGPNDGPIVGNPVSDDGCAIILEFATANRQSEQEARNYVGAFDLASGQLLALLYSGNAQIKVGRWVGGSVLIVAADGATMVTPAPAGSCVRT